MSPSPSEPRLRGTGRAKGRFPGGPAHLAGGAGGERGSRSGHPPARNETSKSWNAPFVRTGPGRDDGARGHDRASAAGNDPEEAAASGSLVLEELQLERVRAGRELDRSAHLGVAVERVVLEDDLPVDEQALAVVGSDDELVVAVDGREQVGAPARREVVEPRKLERRVFGVVDHVFR